MRGSARPNEGPTRPDEVSARPNEEPARPNERPTRPDEVSARPNERPARPDEVSARPNEGPTRPDEVLARPNEEPARPDEGPQLNCRLDKSYEGGCPSFQVSAVPSGPCEHVVPYDDPAALHDQFDPP